MSDLISRKALLTELSKWDISKMYFPADFKELVENQPTAYDLDKVVEQLKDCEEDHVTKYENAFTFRGECFENGKYRAYRHAIEIVKGGSDE